MTEKEILIDTILTLIKSGLSMRESLVRLELEDKYGTVKNWLLKDSRYIAYRKEAKQLVSDESKSLASKVMNLYDAGVPNRKIAEELNIPKGTVSSVVSRSKVTGLSHDERREISAITLDDVELLKEMTCEGEVLCCDITEYGTREYCLIEKKYPHFAKTDKGGIPWTWLTVMNRGRIGK